MKVEQVVCDECRKIRGVDNHWLKIGVLRLPEGQVTQLTLGNIPEKSLPNFEIHDLCAPSCFHAHIDKLLGYPGKRDPVEPPLMAAESWRAKEAKDCANAFAPDPSEASHVPVVAVEYTGI